MVVLVTLVLLDPLSGALAQSGRPPPSPTTVAVSAMTLTPEAVHAGVHEGGEPATSGAHHHHHHADGASLTPDGVVPGAPALLQVSARRAWTQDPRHGRLTSPQDRPPKPFLEPAA